MNAPLPKNQVLHLLKSDSVRNQIEIAVPESLKKYLTSDRLTRIALTEMRKTPKLAECYPESIVGSIIQAAQAGLEPGGALGHCYLVPFKNKNEKRLDCQLIIGYRGMIDLARRSEQIEQIGAWVVRKNDKFSVTFGLDPNIEHVPDLTTAPQKNGQDIQFVYAVAKLKGGGKQFDVMPKVEVDMIRSGSQGKDLAPWREHYAEMAKKTVIRRLFKMLPVSLNAQHAAGLDEQADFGSQQNDAILDGEFSEVKTADQIVMDTPDDDTSGFIDEMNSVNTGYREDI